MEEKKGICPLLNRECEGEECQWWIRGSEPGKMGCAFCWMVTELARLNGGLNQIFHALGTLKR
ncbi:MAG: hypothetical protein DRG40_02780 [Deltaproteobacteria bacterium]|nr:MAG: hypothetical protein DRG40_02780 [Deltaproteobacteria bacterium]